MSKSWPSINVGPFEFSSSVPHHWRIVEFVHVCDVGLFTLLLVLVWFTWAHLWVGVTLPQTESMNCPRDLDPNVYSLPHAGYKVITWNEKIVNRWNSFFLLLLQVQLASEHLDAAAAKSLQSCLTLWDPIDGSPPGSAVPGILKARTLEWVAISFSNAWKWKVKVKSLGRVWLLATPWTAAHQAPPSLGFSSQEYWSRVPSPPKHLDRLVKNPYILVIWTYDHIFVFKWQQCLRYNPTYRQTHQLSLEGLQDSYLKVCSVIRKR